MSRTTDNTEELFRFASTRAPSTVAQADGLLKLANDTDVPLWLAAAHEQDFAVQLDSLEARWRALTGRNASACADLLIGSNAQEPQATTALFPIVPQQDCGAALDALLTGLWKFYLQGISSGMADADQLKRAQQLMGQAVLLQSAVATNSGKIEPSRLTAALTPVLRLPAAFEQQMRARREGAASLRIDTANEHRQARERINARLALLETLEQDLLTALALTGPAGAPAPFAQPVTSTPQDSANAQRHYHFQPAADPGERFRFANEGLVRELNQAQIVTAGQTPYQLLDEVRRQMAELVLASARMPLPASVPAHSPAPGGRFGIRPVGVADLRVVRQTLLGYEKGELSHIDNLVDGESRERRHSAITRTEEGLTDYNERDSEQWRENQSADRFELGRFTYVTARESQDNNSSITITGTYGDVQIQTSTFMAASRGRDETIGEDQRRSREVIDRALQLTRERVGQYRWRNVLSEVQETTIHKQKAKCGHLVAQYRWVDKVYQAQVFNVGARAMYEVMVPSPAAMFTQLLAQQPGVSAHAGPAPAPPALQAADITDSSWACLAALHGVTLPAPPAAAITQYAQATYPAGDSSGVFTLPAALEHGYQAASAGCSMAWFGAAQQCGVTASIGTLLFASSADADGAIAPQPLGAHTGAVNYSASAWGAVDQYTVNFYIVWTRTRLAVEQWQLECHRIILEAYERRLAQHRERQAVPLTDVQMRGIERTELKRAIVALVRGATGQTPPATARTSAGIDTGNLETTAREVRFVEYAFEWDQMTYRFLPYFWQPQDGWHAGQFGQQGDCVFQAFLSAGFASVILPVRKGFEDAAALYLQTGLILDLPVVAADEHLAAMNREVALINAAVETGVPEGEPWSYRVPTTLVLLDDGTDAALPQLLPQTSAART